MLKCPCGVGRRNATTPFFIAVMSDDTKLLETIFDNLQELKTRQLLDEATTRELVEESSRQFDELTYQLQAIKKQLRQRGGWWRRAILTVARWLIDEPEIDFDSLVEAERRESLRRRFVILTKRLGILLEQQAQYGAIAAPAHLIVQIEAAEEEISALRIQLEHK